MANTVKFSRSASPRTLVTVADNAALTLPNGDWTIGIVVHFDGVMSGYGGIQQYLFRTGEYGQAGHLSLLWAPFDAAANAGFFQAYIGSVGSIRCVNPIVAEAGKSYLVCLQRVSGKVYSKACPVLLTTPTDGSAVLTNVGAEGEFTGWVPATTEMDGPGALIIGGRSGTDRQLDQSVGRLFCVHSALTNFQLAQLAHGKEISDITPPAWHFRMSSAADLNDSGPSALQATSTGALVDGATVAYGYTPPAVAPTISGAPAIIGTPQVGTAVSYTSATASGTPTPTTTQQWVLDGADIAGATGATYTPILADAGKSLQVRQIATNSGGNTSAISAGVAVTNNVAGVTVAELTAERVYQRIGATAAVAISGAYSGPSAPSTIEYQLYAPDGVTVRQAWTSAAATISGGTWSAAPLLPPHAKKYRIAVRSKNGAGTVLATSPVSANKFGVGDIIIAIGSSSAAGWFASTFGVTDLTPDHDSTSTLDVAAWALFANPSPATGMAKYIAAQLGVCVAMVPRGASGTNLSHWIVPSNSTFVGFRDAVAAVGGKIGGVFVTVGSNDATSASLVTSRAQHLGNMRTLVSNIRSETDQPSLPILWSGINRRTAAIQADFARMAENDIGDDANVYHVQTLDFELSSDETHLTSAGYQACCVRTREVWAAARLGNYRRGPKIASVTYGGSAVQVTLTHRGASDFLPAAGITGFTVTDASGALTISSAVRANASRVTLTCNRALVAPVVVKYLSGPAPAVGTPVLDTGTPALPMVVETEMAATYLAVTDETAPTMTGALAASAVTSSGFDLSWSAASDDTSVTGYERSLDGGATYVDIGNVTTSSPTGLAASTAYPARVRAYDAAGNRSAPLSLTVTTAAGQAPGDTTAPSLAGVLTVSSQTPAGFTLAWPAATDAVGVSGYEFSVDGGATYTNAGNVLTRVVSGLTPSTVYQVRVRAFDAAGNRSAALSNTATTAEGGSMSFTPSTARTIKVDAAAKTFTGGPFWNLSNPLRPVGAKDPNSIIDITFDWSDVLADIGDYIAEIEFVLAGLIDAGSYGAGALATVFVSAGTGQEVGITCRITTASSPPRVEDRTIYLKMGEQ